MGVLCSHMLPFVVHGLAQGNILSHTGDKTDFEEGAFNIATGRALMTLSYRAPFLTIMSEFGQESTDRMGETTDRCM